MTTTFNRSIRPGFVNYCNSVNTDLKLLSELAVGDKFFIPSMIETKCDMEVLEIEDDAVYVKGKERRTKTNAWKPFHTWMSRGVYVSVNL